VEEQIKFSELKGRAVVNVEDAKKIGEIDNLLLEPGTRRVSSLKVKPSGLFSTPLTIAISQLMNIGPDAVTVKAPPATSAQTSSSDESFELTSVLGHKVVTDAGALLGEIHDVLLDPVNAAVTGYEVREGGIFAKSLEIAATPDVRYGEQIITIPAPLPS
jgi:uncharacterized protein YrrD